MHAHFTHKQSNKFPLCKCTLLSVNVFDFFSYCLKCSIDFNCDLLFQSGVYDDLGDDRLSFTSNAVNDVVVSSPVVSTTHLMTSESFYPSGATIRGQYSIAPATTIVNGHTKTYHTIVNVTQQPKKH